MGWEKISLAVIMWWSMVAANTSTVTFTPTPPKALSRWLSAAWWVFTMRSAKNTCRAIWPNLISAGTIASWMVARDWLLLSKAAKAKGLFTRTRFGLKIWADESNQTENTTVKGCAKARAWTGQAKAEWWLERIDHKVSAKETSSGRMAQGVKIQIVKDVKGKRWQLEIISLKNSNLAIASYYLGLLPLFLVLFGFLALLGYQ
jgi:hypothetical protein